MYQNILSEKQNNLLDLISKFKDDFGLVGGTSIALQLGHRKSIDFDLFTNKEFENEKIINIIKQYNSIDSVIVDELEQLSIIVNEVKLTFLRYPYKLDFSLNFENILKMPDLITLGSMKAYTLGRRSKWKDYVDLYYIFKQYSIDSIINKAKNIYGNIFNSKIFREQLAYFADIDYTEEIVFVGEKVLDSEIKKSLVQISLQ